MAIAQIDSWLQSGNDYKAGLELYKQFGNNNALLILLRSGENAYTRKRLYQALSELSPQKPVADQTAIPAAAKQSHELPKDLKALKTKTINLYKDMSAMHQRLEDDMTTEERNILAQQILDTDDQVQAGFMAVDHYQDSGTRLVVATKSKRKGKDVRSMSPSELALALKNIPTYITKIQKAIASENLSAARLEKLQTNLALYEDDLKYVKKQLKV